MASLAKGAELGGRVVIIHLGYWMGEPITYVAIGFKLKQHCPAQSTLLTRSKCRSYVPQKVER